MTNDRKSSQRSADSKCVGRPTGIGITRNKGNALRRDDIVSIVQDEIAKNQPSVMSNYQCQMMLKHRNSKTCGQNKIITLNHKIINLESDLHRHLNKLTIWISISQK